MEYKNQEIRKCLCCDNLDLQVLFENMKDKLHFIDGKFSLMKCKNCDFIFLHPFLNESQLAKYYPSEEYYSFNNVNKLALVYHNISAFYASRKSLVFNSFFKILNPLLYSYPIDRGKKVLEIGCGDGMKLKILKKYGMETQGLEPYGEDLTDQERELGIIRSSIKNASYEIESFDYIILKEVLEHVPDQKLVLKSCYKWLKKGGKLIITVPNTSGLWEKIFKKNWFGYDVPRHLYNYNSKNIKNFLKSFGFKIENLRTYDLPYMFDGSLKFRISRSKKDPFNFVFSNFTKIISTPMSLITSYFNLGSLMEVECLK